MLLGGGLCRGVVPVVPVPSRQTLSLSLRRQAPPLLSLRLPSPPLLWLRVTARVVDLLGWLLTFRVLLSLTADRSFLEGWWRWLVVWVLLVLWVWLFETVTVALLGASPGKLLCDLRVVGCAGSRVSWRKAAVRAVPVAALLLPAAGLVVAWRCFVFVDRDLSGRGLLDKVAFTRVVDVSGFDDRRSLLPRFSDADVSG